MQLGVNVPLLKASSVAASLSICCPTGLDAWTKHPGRPVGPQALLSNEFASILAGPLGSGVKTEPVSTFNWAAMSWWARLRAASPPFGGVCRIVINSAWV